MVVAISRFTVSHFAACEIKTRFAQRPRLVDQHQGSIGCEVLKTSTALSTFVLITRWQSRAWPAKAYLQSDDFKSVHTDNDEAGADFKVYEMVAR